MTIKAGDLVIIVAPMPCGCAASLGKVFEVARVCDAPSGYCVHCRKSFGGPIPAAVQHDGLGVHLYRLKKIDPLPEHTPEDEEQTA